MTDGMGVGSSDTNLKRFVITTLGNRYNFGANFLQSHLHAETLGKGQCIVY